MLYHTNTHMILQKLSGINLNHKSRCLCRRQRLLGSVEQNTLASRFRFEQCISSHQEKHPYNLFIWESVSDHNTLCNSQNAVWHTNHSKKNVALLIVRSLTRILKYNLILKPITFISYQKLSCWPFSPKNYLAEQFFLTQGFLYLLALKSLPF